jgi:NitT/TauT family transport system substrate-binding protein
LVIAGGLWQRHAADAPLDKAGAVRLAAPLAVAAAPIWVAQDRGYFARAGLESTVSKCSAGKDCIDAMYRGEADLATATEFVAARLSFSQKDLRIVGTTAFSHDMRLLADKSKGIAGVADIKGKRLGVGLGTSGEYFLSRLLTRNGMDQDAITWVDLKPQEMDGAVGAGNVDAVLTWTPFANQVKAALGDRLVEFDGQPGEDYYFLLMGQQAWLTAQPKTAERVMLALIWATDWMSAHPEETRTYLVGKFGVPPEDIGPLMEKIRFSIDLPQALLSALEAESHWLEKKGSKGTPLANSLDLIVTSPLQAAEPDSVTIIRGRSAKH